MLAIFVVYSVKCSIKSYLALPSRSISKIFIYTLISLKLYLPLCHVEVWILITKSIFLKTLSWNLSHCLSKSIVSINLWDMSSIPWNDVALSFSGRLWWEVKLVIVCMFNFGNTIININTYFNRHISVISSVWMSIAPGVGCISKVG